MHSIIHFILFGLCFYFGFIQKPKDDHMLLAGAQSLVIRVYRDCRDNHTAIDMSLTALRPHW